MARSRVGTIVRGWVALPILAAIAVLLPVPGWFVEEFYSRGVYPWLQLGVTTISNLVPIALLDVLIVTAAGVCLFRAVRFVQTAMSDSPAAVWEVVRRLLRAAAVIVLVFFFAWGCHYRRTPLETTIKATPAAPSIAALQLAIADANALGATLRVKLPAAED